MICEKYKYALQLNQQSPTHTNWIIVEAHSIKHDMRKHDFAVRCVFGTLLDTNNPAYLPLTCKIHRWKMDTFFPMTFYETLEALYEDNMGLLI